MADKEWRTLPLFATGKTSREETGTRVRRRKEQSPVDLVLHVYWAAGIEAHALGSLAARTPHPDQQRALRALQTVEAQRKDLAAQALETIWGVRLLASPSHDGTEDADGRAA